MAVAIPVGLVLAAAFGAITLWSGIAEGGDALLAAVVVALATASSFIALIWALVVERSTLRGAVDAPEESIESNWLNTAMQGAFTDTLTVSGLALAALGVTGYHLDAIWALTGVVLVAFASVTFRYLVASRRG